jgi:hypothetical protein
MPFDKKIPPEFPRVTEITEPKDKRQLCARADYVMLIEADDTPAPTLVGARYACVTARTIAEIDVCAIFASSRN